MTTSLLQSPRRPSSEALVLGSLVPRNPGQPFSGSGGFGGLDDEPETVDLGRELDLAGERPHAGAKPGRGPGVLVAAIVASSLTLAGVIMLVRGDVRPPQSEEVAAPEVITEVMSAPAELPAEPVVAEPAPIEPPSRVAAQRVPAVVKVEPAPAEITPAAIVPARSTPSSAPTTTTPPAEVAPASGLAPGLSLPAPVFDDPEPPAASEPVTVPPADHVTHPLPGIEEQAPAEPRHEPETSVPPPEPTASEAGAEPTHAGMPVDPVELLDRLPAGVAS